MILHFIYIKFPSINEYSTCFWYTCLTAIIVRQFFSYLLLNKYLENDNGNILVHCHAGRERSATIVAAYLIYKFCMSPDEAYDFIIEKRPEAFHYGKFYNFHTALQNYYNDLYI